MCLLSYYPPGVMPVREHLEAGVRLNPHGAGYAIVRPDAPRMKNGRPWIDRGRGMNGNILINAFMFLREFCPDGSALFHARFSSGGAVDCMNSQPMHADFGPDWTYPVLIAHNGFLFPAPGRDSDTQIFVEDILPKWDIRDPAIRAELERLIDPNKVAVMSTEDGSVTILNEHRGITLPDGAWHSNISYTGEWHLTEGECGVCHEPSEVPVCEPCRADAEPRRLALLKGPQGC